jgi:hypothetical protein
MEMTEKSGYVYNLIQNNRHNRVNIGLIFTSFGTFALTAAFNGLAGSGAGVPDIFFSTAGDISDIFELFITPAGKLFCELYYIYFRISGFAFSIWTLIYLWLAISLVIFIVSIFLQNYQGKYENNKDKN